MGGQEPGNRTGPKRGGSQDGEGRVGESDQGSRQEGMKPAWEGPGRWGMSSGGSWVQRFQGHVSAHTCVSAACQCPQVCGDTCCHPGCVHVLGDGHRMWAGRSVCEIDTGGTKSQISALLGGLGEGSAPVWASQVSWGLVWA